jgi:hypothetical protein
LTPSLERDIESALLDVIEKEIDLRSHCDILKCELEIHYDYTSLADYCSIDKYNDGRSDTTNLAPSLVTKDRRHCSPVRSSPVRCSDMLNRHPSNYWRDDCFYSDTQVEFRNTWCVHLKVEVAAEAS